MNSVFTRAELAALPFSQRRNGIGPSFLKVVPGEPPFLMEWAFPELKREPYGVHSARPMVYFANAHESVEKGMWCYLNGMTRFLGEVNSEVSNAAAQKFAIDSLIADEECLMRMSPVLPMLESLQTISILGADFDIGRIRPFAQSRRVRLVLTLPETGVIGESNLAQYPRFTIAPDSEVEEIGGELILTKRGLSATPIARYATGIRGSLDGETWMLAR